MHWYSDTRNSGLNLYPDMRIVRNAMDDYQASMATIQVSPSGILFEIRCTLEVYCDTVWYISYEQKRSND